MTGEVVSHSFPSQRSFYFGGDGSIIIEVRRNGASEPNHRAVLFSRNGRVPVASGLTNSSGQITFENLDTTVSFTAVAYDLQGISQGAVKTDITPMISPEATVLDFAGQGAAGPNTATVSLVLRDRNGNIRANLTDLHWVFFDQAEPGGFVAVTDSGSGETTDGSGNFQVTVNNTTLNNGETGFIIISDTDGDAEVQSLAHAAPVQVVVS